MSAARPANGVDDLPRRQVVGEPVVVFGLVAALAVVLWFALGMHRGLLLSSDVKGWVWPWAPLIPTTEPQAPTMSDPVWQFVPYVELARRELSEGRLPLWNPYQHGGVPLLGNYVSGLASPLLAPALLLGVENGWNLSLLLRLVAAVAAAYVWLRDLGRTRPSSILGAVAFALSGPFVAWLELPHTLVAPAIPLLLMFARRTAARGGRSDVGGLIVATLLVLLGGHPEVAFFAALLALVVVLAAARSVAGVARAFGAAFAGALLAAPVLVPFLESWVHSAERLGANRFPHTVPLAALARLVFPGADIGHPIAAAATVSTPVVLLAVTALLILWRDRGVRLWGGIALALLVAIYDNPLARWLSEATPLYWSRALLVLPLPFAALATHATDRCCARVGARYGRAAALLLVVAVAGVASTELVFAARGVHAVTLPSLVRRSTPILDTVTADRSVFRILPLHTFLPPNSASEFFLEDVRGYEALSPRGWLLERESIGHFTGTNTVSDVLEPWNLAPGGAALDYWNVKYLLVHPQLPLTAARLNRELGFDLEEVYSGPDGRLLRNRRVLPRARVEAGGSVAILSRTTTLWRLRVEAEKATTLVVANPYFPGWRALVDGELLEVAVRPGEAVSVPVPSGTHLIELRYAPRSLSLGLLLAVLGLLSTAIWVRSLPVS